MKRRVGARDRREDKNNDCVSTTTASHSLGSWEQRRHSVFGSFLFFFSFVSSISCVNTSSSYATTSHQIIASISHTYGMPSGIISCDKKIFLPITTCGECEETKVMLTEKIVCDLKVNSGQTNERIFNNVRQNSGSLKEQTLPHTLA